MRGYENRQRLEPCGCHVDAPTGLITAFCRQHDPNRRKTRLAKFAQDCRHNAGLPPFEDADEDAANNSGQPRLARKEP